MISIIILYNNDELRASVCVCVYARVFSYSSLVTNARGYTFARMCAAKAKRIVPVVARSCAIDRVVGCVGVGVHIQRLFYGWRMRARWIIPHIASQVTTQHSTLVRALQLHNKYILYFFFFSFSIHALLFLPFIFFLIYSLFCACKTMQTASYWWASWYRDLKQYFTQSRCDWMDACIFHRRALTHTQPSRLCCLCLYAQLMRSPMERRMTHELVHAFANACWRCIYSTLCIYLDQFW